jgi:hypothetical protein
MSCGSEKQKHRQRWFRKILSEDFHGKGYTVRIEPIEVRTYAEPKFDDRRAEGHFVCRLNLNMRYYQTIWSAAHGTPVLHFSDKE